MLNALAEEMVRLAPVVVETGEADGATWLTVAIEGMEFLITVQPFWREGLTIYARHPLPDTSIRQALIEAAMARNFETFHGWGPVYCLEKNTGHLVAMLRIPFQEAHTGTILGRLHDVVQQYGKWSEARLIDELVDTA